MTSSAVKCPNSQTIYPCSCAQYINQISCWNIKSNVNLTQIFVNLTNDLGENNKKIVYDEFKLIDSELTEIGTDDSQQNGGDFFNGVAFQKINIIKNRNLKRIHKNAFKSSFNITTSLTISENPIFANDPPNEREIFDLLNSFESATEIWLTDNNISVIPEKAFTKPQDSLTWLSFIDNNIVRIGDYAFRSLTTLNYILLDGNRIDKISNKAFDLVESPENQLLRLFLRDNYLNDNSFETGTFERLRRKVLLDLSKNNITHLKKQVFAPLFRRNGSAIILRHNPLMCDCNFKWLFDRKLLYNSSNTDQQYYVHHIQCNGTKHDSIKMNELSEANFDHCPQEETGGCIEYDYELELCINSAKSFQVLNQLFILLINLILFYLLI